MDLAHELHDLVLTLDRQAEALLQPDGLTYRRYVALVIIGEHPGMTGRDLAGALGVSEPAASGIVRRLITDQLIQDSSGAGSGHVRRLELTPSGQELLARASRRLGNTLDATVREIGIDPAELAETLHRIHQRILPASAADSGPASAARRPS